MSNTTTNAVTSNGKIGEKVLDVSGVSKRFGGLQALSDVGIRILRGQVYGLIGPNGAGKTTFFNVLTGLYTPDGGTFELADATRQHQLATDVRRIILLFFFSILGQGGSGQGQQDREPQRAGPAGRKKRFWRHGLVQLGQPEDRQSVLGRQGGCGLSVRLR